METPFNQIYGHDLSVNDINDIFIEDPRMIQEFVAERNSFIWGVRGSGKSMMLKYFDIEVQCVRCGGFQQAIKKNCFVGVYLLFKRGVFNTPNLAESNQDRPKMIHSSVLYILSEHLILASILEELFEKLCVNIDFEFTLEGNTEFYHTVFENLCYKEKELSSISSDAEFFRMVCNSLKVDIRNIRRCLTELAIGKDADFSAVNFLDYSTFCEVIRAVQKWINVKCKCEKEPLFYFLLDDVNFLFTYQQKILNTWIGQRQTDMICFKLASEPFGYKSFMTFSDEWELQNVADFHEFLLDFDVIYDKKQKRKIYEAIANQRISYFKKHHQDTILPDSIAEFLPSDQQQDRRIEELRRELSEKYADKERDRSRQVMPELHRRYGRVYCGFEDVITISFGNIRDFLVLCNELYLYYSYQEQTSVTLSTADQDKAIREFSRKLRNFKDYLSISTDEIDNQLYTFLLNILSLIGHRLKEGNQMEKTFDAFIIKNISSLGDTAKAVLRRGIERRLFRKSYYSGKKYLRQDVFIINKRLFPADELNISEVGGRFEFTPEQISKALTDEKYFVKEELRNPTHGGQLSLFEPQDANEFDEDDELGVEEKYEYDYGNLY